MCTHTCTCTRPPAAHTATQPRTHTHTHERLFARNDYGEFHLFTARGRVITKARNRDGFSRLLTKSELLLRNRRSQHPTPRCLARRLRFANSATFPARRQDGDPATLTGSSLGPDSLRCARPRLSPVNTSFPPSPYGAGRRDDACSEGSYLSVPRRVRQPIRRKSRTRESETRRICRSRGQALFPTLVVILDRGSSPTSQARTTINKVVMRYARLPARARLSIRPPPSPQSIPVWLRAAEYIDTRCVTYTTRV